MPKPIKAALLGMLFGVIMTPALIAAAGLGLPGDHAVLANPVLLVFVTFVFFLFNPAVVLPGMMFSSLVFLVTSSLIGIAGNRARATPISYASLGVALSPFGVFWFGKLHPFDATVGQPPPLWPYMLTIPITLAVIGTLIGAILSDEQPPSPTLDE